MSQEIYEAFQELQGLEEATFSFDKPGMLGLQQFLNADDYVDDAITVVDINAEEDKDKKENYDGDAVLECCVCGGKITCDPKEVVIDQETQRANVEQECPYCYNVGGYKIIGQIEAPEAAVEETEEKVEGEEEPIEVDTKNITVEEKEEPKEESKEEPITEAKKDNGEELWYQVYDALVKLGKNSVYKKGGNTLAGQNQKAARISLGTNGSGIVVKAETEDDLAKVKAVADKFADKGITYSVTEDKFGAKKLKNIKDRMGDKAKELDLTKYYPYIVTVNVPEDESVDLNESFDPDKKISIKEEDIINFDEETGDLETALDYFPDDVKAGDKFIVKFVDEESDYPVEFIFAFKEVTKYGTAALEWVDNYEEIPSEEPEDDDLDESFKGADIILSDEDIKDVDDKTAEITLTKEASQEIDGGDYSDVVSVGFEDDKTEKIYTYEMYKEDEEGCIHMRYMGKIKGLNESIENISVETDSDTINVKPSENGSVTVEAQPKEAAVDMGEATIAPVSDEVKSEIEANSVPEGEEEMEDTEVEEVEESPEGEDNEDVELSDFDEESFDELGESYLKEVYDNVDSFKTTKGYINDNKLKLEGIIKFNSGKQAKTSFLFESNSVSRKGKYKFMGENLQITNRKNAFMLAGDIKEGKLLPESLTYNYNAKDLNTGKLQRVYGTVKTKNNK